MYKDKYYKYKKKYIQLKGGTKDSYNNFLSEILPSNFFYNFKNDISKNYNYKKFDLSSLNLKDNYDFKWIGYENPSEVVFEINFFINEILYYDENGNENIFHVNVKLNENGKKINELYQSNVGGAFSRVLFFTNSNNKTIVLKKYVDYEAYEHENNIINSIKNNKNFNLCKSFLLDFKFLKYNLSIQNIVNLNKLKDYINLLDKKNLKKINKESIDRLLFQNEVSFLLLDSLDGLGLDLAKNINNINSYNIKNEIKVNIFYQIVNMVKCLYKIGFIVPDLKADNFGYKMESENRYKIYLIDFGGIFKKDSQTSLMYIITNNPPVKYRLQIMNNTDLYKYNISLWALINTILWFYNKNENDYYYWNYDQKDDEFSLEEIKKKIKSFLWKQYENTNIHIFNLLEPTIDRIWRNKGFDPILYYEFEELLDNLLSSLYEMSSLKCTKESDNVKCSKNKINYTCDSDLKNLKKKYKYFECKNNECLVSECSQDNCKFGEKKILYCDEK